jgi:hypothetical protein
MEHGATYDMVLVGCVVKLLVYNGIVHGDMMTPLGSCEVLLLESEN